MLVDSKVPVTIVAEGEEVDGIVEENRSDGLVAKSHEGVESEVEDEDGGGRRVN